MAKWITIAVAAALLFSAGLFAGNSVPFANALANGVAREANPEPAADSKPYGDISAESPNENDSNSISFVSHANASENAEQRSAEFIEKGTPNLGHRTEIRNLILQHFPNTDASVADVWVETYADMSLDEVRFILEQKQQSSNEIGNGFSVSSLAHGVETAPSPSESNQQTSVLIQMVNTNLRCAYSIGYRRTVVLPEVVSHCESKTTAKSLGVLATCFRSFESGALIATPIATYVALTNEDSMMFCLEGNRLTRRGDFQLLPDRRLGIVTSGEQMASAESTPLPDDATDVQILQNGRIQFRNAAGVTGDAGRIAVCSVTDLAQLQSDDGVFFTASDDGNISPCADASAFLRPKSLEQSNVDRSYENSLLEHLKSLTDPFKH